MIIRYPTGLYKTVLPSEPSDGGNVTYTISNNPPPRTNLLFPKIPNGIIDRPKELPPLDIVLGRSEFGILVFTVTRSSRTLQNNTAKQYEIGQTLEFDDGEITAVDPMLIGTFTETRHDTNLFDFDAMGLTEDEQKLLKDNSLLAQNELFGKLNLARQKRADFEQVVNIQQKIINETTKTIKALQTVESTLMTDEVMSLIEKLEQRLVTAAADRDAAVVSANEQAALATAYADDLRAIGVVVR